MRSILNSVAICLLLVASFPAAAGQVSRAMFTVGVEDREPVLKVDSINSNSYKQISFFTELMEHEGDNVTHQWVYGGKVMFEKTFEVRGPRWRVWTSKSLQPEWTGLWSVNVLDQDRKVLATKSFDYQ